MANDVPNVAMAKYVTIFSGVYVTAFVLGALILYISGVNSGKGVNMAALIVAAMTTSYCFVKRHKRAYGLIEYRKVLLGSVIVDVFFQTIIIELFHSKSVTVGTLISSVAIVAVTHGLLLAVMYSDKMMNVAGHYGRYHEQ
jgi:hypothetical protein